MKSANPGRITYRAVVVSNSLSRSGNNKTPGVKILFQTKFVITDPSVPVEKQIFADLWLTPACVDRTLNSINEAFSVRPKLISDLNEPCLAGKECNIVCETETWEGTEREKVVFINRCPFVKKLDPDSLQQIVSEIQPMLDNYIHQKNVAAFSAGSSDPANPIADDLPF